MKVHTKPPIGWGDDLLTHFQATAILNEYSTFAHQVDWQRLLQDIASDLHKCSRYAIDNIIKVDDASALLLFATAHNQFLGAVRLAASGQCLATYPVSRAAVESALYGWYVSCGADIAKRWHNKPLHGDKEEQKNWNKEYKFSSLCQQLARIAPNEAKWAKHLHQSAIDMGGHPNRDALYSNMRSVQRDDEAPIIQMQFLHQWGMAAAAAMNAAVETGMFILRLFPIAFPESEPNLGVSANAAVFVRRLQKLKQAAKEEFDCQEGNGEK
ncbi:hypothetical protein [Burkholderia seminalis]|uniref:hypothetical protein n=1 Tax=Burkholderia seminalis TaxID=488731 RepID=UPI000A91290A|nr:hypothetical protein [Burkholderia seminalis]